jgi:AraC-like DNA-binding protein
MGIVATLLSHPTRLFRVRAALRGRHSIESCADWAQLTLRCEEQPIHMVVLDLFDTRPMTLEAFRQLTRRFPRLVTVAYVDPGAGREHDLFDAGRSGVNALVLFDRDDDPVSLSATLERAEARGVASLVRAALGTSSPMVRDFVLLCVTRAHERLTPTRVANALNASRRVLARQLEEAHLPPPQRLITCCRLVVAAYFLEDQHRSADSIANALQFPSGSAFRNACQRYLGATPSEIRERGGAQWVVDQLFTPALRRAEGHPLLEAI